MATMRAARRTALLAKLAPALLVLGGAGVVAGADLEKSAPLALKGKADGRKAAGSAVGAAAHTASSEANPTPIGVSVGAHVGVQVAWTRRQSDLAKVPPQLFNTWDQLLQGWGRLERHLGQVAKAEQIQEEWREYLRDFRPIMTKLTNAADKFAGIVKNNTEDATKLDRILIELRHLMDKITILVTDGVHLQVAYARADNETIREQETQMTGIDYIGHWIQIACDTSGTETLEAALKELTKLVAETMDWVVKGADIVKDEKEWVEEAVKSKQDLSGDAGDTASSLEKWVHSTVEKEARLKGELQSAVQGQAHAGGSAALLQQSARAPQTDEAAAAAPADGRGSDLPLTIPALGKGHRQRGKMCAREGAASALAGAGAAVGVGDLAAAAVQA